MDEYTNFHSIVVQKSAFSSISMILRKKTVYFIHQKHGVITKISYFVKSLRIMEIPMKFLKVSCFGREFCPTFDNL